MKNLPALDATFKKYIDSIDKWPKDSVVDVDLPLLHRFDLLEYYDNERHDPALTQYFHVVESPEKITLINDKFVIWIVPQQSQRESYTCTMIALNHPKNVDLELVFVTSGIYNNSKLVLRILEKFLHEIEENEDLLSNFG